MVEQAIKKKEIQAVSEKQVNRKVERMKKQTKSEIEKKKRFLKATDKMMTNV